MELKKIKVLIIDDSSLMRQALKSVLEEDPSVEVIGAAKDGKEGVEKAFALKPDVITMDLKMPVMSGVEAIEKIMEEMPIPIIVVSSMETDVIVKALSIGAMDFVAVTADIETISKELVEKIKIASRVRPLRRMKLKPCIPSSAKGVLGKKASSVVVIGVSTGGPQALQEVTTKLPKDFHGGILVVQHMSKGFIDGLAEWLNATSCLEVRVAKAGDELKTGVIFLAPDSYNMYISKDGIIMLKEYTGKALAHTPSIDETMKSVAESYGEDSVGVIMTGMGQDGVAGIKAIRKAGGRTIAQDQASSVVFGMNKVAIEAGLIDKIVSLSNIADEITNSVRQE